MAPGLPGGWSWRDRLGTPLPGPPVADRHEARVLALSLRSTPHGFRQRQSNHAPMIRLRQLTESATDESSHSRQRDVVIRSAVPWIGRKVLATRLSKAPDAWRKRDLEALRCLCGVTPVTRQCGKTCRVLRRLACTGRNAHVPLWASEVPRGWIAGKPSAEKT